MESNSFSIVPNNTLSYSVFVSSSPYYNKQIRPNYDNNEALKILNTLIEDQKKKGYKYPLISCLFLQFHKSGKNALEKTNYIP